MVIHFPVISSTQACLLALPLLRSLLNMSGHVILMRRSFALDLVVQICESHTNPPTWRLGNKCQTSCCKRRYGLELACKVCHLRRKVWIRIRSKAVGLGALGHDLSHPAGLLKTDLNSDKLFITREYDCHFHRADGPFLYLLLVFSRH